MVRNLDCIMKIGAGFGRGVGFMAIISYLGDFVAVRALDQRKSKWSAFPKTTFSLIIEIVTNTPVVKSESHPTAEGPDDKSFVIPLPPRVRSSRRQHD